MTQVNVFEVKAKFAEYLDRAAGGERIVIYRYNKPVAELRPVEIARIGPRPIGPLEGRPTFDVPPAFFDPLDEGELAAWEGVAPGDPLTSAFPPRLPDSGAKVAESAPPAPAPRRRTKGRRS
jgi:antitoxin (DNA-binding transcriptional repressor) of toxin-antitoxin stability system